MDKLYKNWDIHKESWKQVEKTFETNKWCEWHCMSWKKYLCNKFDTCWSLVDEVKKDIDLVFTI